jgi:hypothetical protein
MHEDKTAVKNQRVVSGGKPLKNGNLKGEPVWEYSKSPESKDHVVLKDKYDLFIGGKRVKTKKYFDSVIPPMKKSYHACLMHQNLMLIKL